MVFEAPRATSTPPSILVVDDQPQNIVVLEAILGDPGYDIITARSGPEALEHFSLRDFAVVITDIMMPGMDGFEFAMRIKENPAWCEKPIIFVTAADPGELDFVYRAYDVGAVDYLTKPFIPAVVKAKVKIFVDLHQRTKALEAAESRLQQIKRQLEERVRERTYALEKANDELMVLDREKGMLLEAMSRELRTPTSKILDCMQLLRSGQVSSSDLPRIAGDLNRSAKTQLRLIDNLLDMSRSA